MRKENKKGVQSRRLYSLVLDRTLQTGQPQEFLHRELYYYIEWPSLELLEIESCPKMETFGCGVQVTPKLKKLRQGYGASEIRMDGDLNAIVQQIIKEKAWAYPPEEGCSHSAFASAPSGFFFANSPI